MSPTAVRIPPSLLEQLHAAACAADPDECCGYLVGPRGGDAVDTAIACRNAQLDGGNPVAPDRGAETGFVIDGKELFGFAASLDGPRPARVVYHSHTNGRAYLSEVDRALAVTPSGPVYPVQHLVLGVLARRPIEAALFGWSDAARDYVEIARWTV